MNELFLTCVTNFKSSECLITENSIYLLMYRNSNKV